MYYYIYESVKTSSDRKSQDKIKSLIASVGISGEQVTPNPARTIDELVDIGMTKGYSTLVAIGTDIFANKIASSILNQQKEESQKVVFGFIPNNVNTSQLAQTLQLDSLEEAVTALRFRKLDFLSIAILMPNKFFLVPLKIIDNKAFNLNLKLPRIQAQATASEINISPEIEVTFNDESASDNKLVGFFGKLFKGKSENKPNSYFKTTSFDLKTDPVLPVLLGEEVIAQTPIRVKSLPDYLHVIVNRATIVPMEKETPTLETEN